jgi:nitroimidazol reductase NimA-like FMN-containing flavoprotein (pyridoxamine 5'-phosphate oxidase superfamily)
MGKEAKEWKTSWGREFLESVEILHFATLGEDGAPIVRPVNFLYQNGKIYIHSGPKSGKISQIRRDPRVCLEATEAFAYIPAKEAPPKTPEMAPEAPIMGTLEPGSTRTWSKEASRPQSR